CRSAAPAVRDPRSGECGSSEAVQVTEAHAVFAGGIYQRAVLDLATKTDCFHVKKYGLLFIEHVGSAHAKFSVDGGFPFIGCAVETDFVAANAEIVVDIFLVLPDGGQPRREHYALAELPGSIQSQAKALTVAVARYLGEPLGIDVDQLVLPLHVRPGPEAAVAIIHAIENPR